MKCCTLNVTFFPSGIDERSTSILERASTSAEAFIQLMNCAIKHIRNEKINNDNIK